MKTNTVKIFTDGACSGNPGPGGWGVVIKGYGLPVELSGYEADTTNNRMELTAVIAALKEVDKQGTLNDTHITITTDSQYVVNTITKGWKRKANTDLWAQLDKLLDYFSNVSFVWVKGHAGHPENERCDELATQAIAQKAGVSEISKAEAPAPEVKVNLTKMPASAFWLGNDIKTGVLAEGFITKLNETTVTLFNQAENKYYEVDPNAIHQGKSYDSFGRVQY